MAIQQEEALAFVPAQPLFALDAAEPTTEHGRTTREDVGRGDRRVVPSPKPVSAPRRSLGSR